MKTCKQVQELLDSYLDHTCSQEETDELLAHFASCGDCRKQAEEMKTLLALLSSQTETEPPADLHEKIMSAIKEDPKKKTVFFYPRLVPYGIIAAVFVIYFGLGGPQLLPPLFGSSQNMTQSAAVAPSAAPAPRAFSSPAPQAPQAPATASGTPSDGAKIAVAPDAPSMKSQAILPPASEDKQFSAQMATPSLAALPVNPPATIAAAPAAPPMAEQTGFVAHLYTKGTMSAFEIASILKVSIAEGATQFSIPKELLPRLSQLCSEYGFTLDIQGIDDALPNGMLEVIA